MGKEIPFNFRYERAIVPNTIREDNFANVGIEGNRYNVKTFICHATCWAVFYKYDVGFAMEGIAEKVEIDMDNLRIEIW